MRYDIYTALTEKLVESKSLKMEIERKILKSMLPAELERKVAHISKSKVEFDTREESGEIEFIAQAINLDNDDSDSKNAISISVASNNGASLITSEEIVGMDTKEDKLCYSCVEIIGNAENTLIIAGTVTYGGNVAPRSVKTGSWVYDTKLVKEFKPLADFCRTHLDTIDAFDKLEEIQEILRKNQYIRPENYVTATIFDKFEPRALTIDNDGEVEPLETYKNTFCQNFLDCAELYEDPKTILRKLHSISDFLYIDVCDCSLYGKFSTKDFIKTIQKLQTQEEFQKKPENEEEKPKQFIKESKN